MRFAIIAGIMALESLEVSVNRAPVVEAFNGAPVYVEASHARDDAISFLATCNSAVGESRPCSAGMAQAHRSYVRAALSKLRSGATFAVLDDDDCKRF